MGFLVFLIIVLLFVGFIFVNIKINNLKYRAKQHILKDTGISSADINATINSGVEKKQLQKFLEDNTDFTEESIKDLLKEYTVQLINRNSIDEFSETTNEKMQKDSKLEKIKNMQFRRVNIMNYGNSKLNAVVVYTDNRDEYNIYLICDVIDNKIKLDKYRISKGAVVGL